MQATIFYKTRESERQRTRRIVKGKDLQIGKLKETIRALKAGKTPQDFGPDGNVYVSNFGFGPPFGQVVKITVVKIGCKHHRDGDREDDDDCDDHDDHRDRDRDHDRH